MSHLVADDGGTTRPVGLQDSTLKNQLLKAWISGQQKQAGYLFPPPLGKTRQSDLQSGIPLGGRQVFQAERMFGIGAPLAVCETQESRCSPKN